MERIVTLAAIAVLVLPLIWPVLGLLVLLAVPVVVVGLIAMPAVYALRVFTR